MDGRRAWWSRTVLITGIAAIVLPFAGALGTRFGLWNFKLGLLLWAVGLLIGLICFIGGIVALIAVQRHHRTAERMPVFLGTAFAAVMVVFLGAQVAGARSVPPIHNISTDVSDPPSFDVAVKLRGEGPDSNPLDVRLAGAAAEAAGRVSARTAARPIGAACESFRRCGRRAGHGARDREQGREAPTHRSGGDVVLVRIQGRRRGPDSRAGHRYWTGSVVDLRSVSRVGVSDLGINAKRIEEFLDRFNGA